MKELPSLLLLVVAALPLAAQEADISPGDNLVVQGIPKIPASLVETVGRYTEFRAAGFTSWHPTRREMLIATRFGDTFQAHQVKSPGAARTQMTFSRENVFGGDYDPRTGSFFIFSKDKGGDEFYQLYRFDFSSGAVTLLTDGKSRNTSPVLSKTGQLAYGSTRRTGKDVDLWIMDPADPKSNHLLAQLAGGGWGVLDWSPGDKQILVTEEISANETYLWLFDAATGEKSIVTPKNEREKVAYNGGKFGPDGKGIYTATDRESEFQRLAYIDLTTKEHTYLSTHISWDIDAFDLSPDGKTVAFLANEDGRSVFHLLDTTTRKEISAPVLPVEASSLQWHKNGQDIAFNGASARSPRDAYSLHVPTGKVERWTFSETGGINVEHFSQPELVHWKSFDGRQISGFLYRPPVKFTGKRPVIIDIHGGPEGQFRPSFGGGQNYYLNELGIAVLYPNIRGSSGYGKTFLKLDNGYQRVDAYKDISSLLDWISTNADLDPSRIMVTGGSYGGHMTLAVAAYYGERIRCAVDIVGPSNLVTFLENTSGYRQDLRRVEYGDERDPKMREFLNQSAPLTHVAGIKKPLFVVQGANDPRVPRSEAEQMVAAVRRNNTPVWYLLAKDEGHGFAKKKNRDFEFYATVLFVKEYLLN
jgi:dipeptidyl aminopeptidase/acylaminoacyl peptidase